MPREGLEPAAGEQPQTHSLDQAVTGIGDVWFIFHK